MSERWLRNGTEKAMNYFKTNLGIQGQYRGGKG